jgi:hypothetical protein
MSEVGVSEKRKRRAGGIKWFSMLVAAGIVLVTGTVVADVVLSYVATNGIGGPGNSPFQFQNGANYAGAHALNVLTNTYATGTSGPAVTSTISGIAALPVYINDGTEFATAMAIGTDTAVLGTPLATGAITTTGVTCAWAFISEGVPSTGTSIATGCATVAVPTVAAGGPCGAANTHVYEVNLLTHATTGTFDACTLIGTATGTTVLWISYGIETTSAYTVAGTGTTLITVPITWS